MGLAERSAFADEVIGEIGGEQGGIGGGGGATILIDGGVGKHSGHKADAGTDGVGGVEEAFLVFLEVAVVRHGQALEERQERHQVAENAAAFSAREFGDVGIFFLR